MSFKSPWDRIAEALPQIGQTIAQGILMSQEQKRLEAEREAAIQRAAEQAQVADAQARRNQAQQSLASLADTLASMEANDRGDTVAAVRIRERIADLERAANMPIASIGQARGFNEFYGGITNPQATPSTSVTPGGPVGPAPGRTIGFQGGTDGRVEGGGRQLFTPEITATVNPLGTPMQEATRGIGEVAAAQRAEETTAEAAAEEERLADIRARSTQSVAESLRTQVSGYLANENVSNEVKTELQGLDALVQQAFDNPYSVAPSELIAASTAVERAATEIGDAEAASAAAQNTLDLVLQGQNWNEMTTEERLGVIGQLQGLDSWDNLPDETKTSLMDLAQFENPDAILAGAAEDVAKALEFNSFEFLEGNEQAIGIAADALGVTPENVPQELTRRAVSNRDLDILERQAATITAEQTLMAPSKNARNDLGTLVELGDVATIDEILAMEKPSDASNPWMRSLYENLSTEQLREARDRADGVRTAVIAEENLTNLRTIVTNMQGTDTIVNYLSQYSQENIQELVRTNPDIREQIGDAGLARALRQAQTREAIEQVEEIKRNESLPEVRDAYNAIQSALENPSLIGREQQAFQDRPGGPTRGENVAPALTWDELESSLDTLVENNQMTSEGADRVMRSLMVQNQAFITEQERALAEAEMYEELVAAGFFPNWSQSDWRSQILSLESSAESLINEAQVPRIVSYDGDGNPVEVTCFTGSDPLGATGWSSDPACQGIRQEYTETQATIRRFTRNQMLSVGVQTLPPGTRISQAAAIGPDFVDELIQTAAAGNYSADALNRIIDERYAELERRGSPVNLRVTPELGGSLEGVSSSDVLFRPARETPEGEPRGPVEEARAFDEQVGRVMEEFNVSEREARRIIRDAQRRQVNEDRSTITFDELMERGRQAGSAYRATLGTAERELLASPNASRIPSTTPAVGDVRRQSNALPGLAPTPENYVPTGAPAAFDNPLSSVMAEGSAIAESGGDYAAINEGNEDVTGGWSYGKYQFASNGGLRAFLTELERSNPSLLSEMTSAVGVENLDELVDAGVNGSEEFQQAWARLSNNPEFQAVQDLAAERLYFQPAQAALRDYGLQPTSLDPRVLQAFGETAINLGIGNFRTFLEELADDPVDLLGVQPEALVRLIYEKRLQVDEEGNLRWYRSSTPEMQASVQQNLMRVRDSILGAS
jgi:hypothetical protein